jgi:hypothetical protein
MSWKPEVFVAGQWCRNGLVFATEGEAFDSAYDLMGRWILVSKARAAASDEPVNYRWRNGLVSIAEVPA